MEYWFWVISFIIAFTLFVVVIAAAVTRKKKEKVEEDSVGLFFIPPDTVSQAGSNVIFPLDVPSQY